MVRIVGLAIEQAARDQRGYRNAPMRQMGIIIGNYYEFMDVLNVGTFLDRFSAV
jgi:hypothetical protein